MVSEILKSLCGFRQYRYMPHPTEHRSVIHFTLNKIALCFLPIGTTVGLYPSRRGRLSTCHGKNCRPWDLGPSHTFCASVGTSSIDTKNRSRQCSEKRDSESSPPLSEISLWENSHLHNPLNCDDAFVEGCRMGD